MRDLALHMGEDAQELRRRMSEREFGEWGKYAAQRGMPLRRIEVQLARIAMFLEIGLLGGKRSRLIDYMGTTMQELIDGKADTFDALVDDVEDLFGDGGTVIKRAAA